MSKKAKRNPFRRLLLFMVVCCLTVVASGPGISHAQPDIDPNISLAEFWSEYQSVFLYHPYLVKRLFYEIVDLKGNRYTASKFINKEILSCTSGSDALSECRLDQLKIERQKRGISRYITVPANITSIYGQPLKKDKSRYLLTINWQPEAIQPSVITVDEFYNYLGVADNSKYYTGKQGLERIQINPLFEERVTIVTYKARARNILKLYRDPPADHKDAFVFKVDSTYIERNGSTANVNLQLKAVKVKINHLLFQTTKELLQ